MKKLNLYNSKIFFSNHPYVVTTIGSICGAVIVAVSAHNFNTNNNTNNSSSRIEEFKISDSLPAVDKVLCPMTVHSDNSDGFEGIMVHEYAYNVQKNDDTSEWVCISHLKGRTDLVQEYRQIGVKEETYMGNKDKKQYRTVPVYETAYLVYNEDGSKEYRTISYLTDYVKELEEKDLQVPDKVYAYTK